MKTTISKHLYWIIGTVLALGIVLLCVTFPSKAELWFDVRLGTQTQRICAFEQTEGSYVLFLPSSARMSDVEAVLYPNRSIRLDGTRLTDGMPLDGFSEDVDYAVQINGHAPVSLRFLRSGNVASMYVDTASGDMERIHRDKGHEEAP